MLWHGQAELRGATKSCVTRMMHWPITCRLSLLGQSCYVPLARRVGKPAAGVNITVASTGGHSMADEPIWSFEVLPVPRAGFIGRLFGWVPRAGGRQLACTAGTVLVLRRS